MRPLDEVFVALAHSRFRSGKHLRGRDLDYLLAKGLPTVMEHARDFISERLAPAAPPNDGRQTPWRGHPIFVGQHATATCCRSCLEKWHDIAAGHSLGAEEQAHVMQALERWLCAEMTRAPERVVAEAAQELQLEWDTQS